MSCRTGHQDEKGHLWEAKFAEPIYKLVGGEIEFYDLLRPQSPGKINMDGNNYSWVSWGEILRPNPNTETWASYNSEFYAGKASVSFQKFGKGTVTYVGVDSSNGSLEKDVLKKLYTKLDVNIKNYPEGVIVEYRDGFGIALNYSDKDYEVNVSNKKNILVGTQVLAPAGVCVWKIE